MSLIGKKKSESTYYARSRTEFNNKGAFAALKGDGSVVTWGSPITGGEWVNLFGIFRILIKYMARSGFAATRKNGKL